MDKNPVAKAQIAIAEAVLSERGLQARLAKRFGIDKQYVSQWRRTGIPAKYVPGVVEETGGRFTRQQLRPKDWHMYWPELAEV